MKKLVMAVMARIFPFRDLTSLQRMLIVSTDTKRPVANFWSEHAKARVDQS